MDAQDSLQIYAHQQGSTRWGTFVAALMAEFDEVDSGEADAFLHGLGARMARSLPLNPGNSVGELQAAMNAAWQGISWGAVQLQEGDRFLRISHGGYPLLPNSRDGAWLLSILEGVYTEWLNLVGGNAQLRARRVSVQAAPFAPLHFDYGRYD